MISFLLFKIPKIMLKDYIKRKEKKKEEVGMEENLKEKEKYIYKLSNQIVCVSVSIYIIIYKI